jgi:hypothetical protein
LARVLQWLGVNAEFAMRDPSHRLLRHLVIAVVAKLVVLFGLWWVLVRPWVVDVDAQRASERVLTNGEAAR